jgi:hypothetical protein
MPIGLPTSSVEETKTGQGSASGFKASAHNCPEAIGLCGNLVTYLSSEVEVNVELLKEQAEVDDNTVYALQRHVVSAINLVSVSEDPSSSRPGLMTVDHDHLHHFHDIFGKSFKHTLDKSKTTLCALGMPEGVANWDSKPDAVTLLCADSANEKDSRRVIASIWDGKGTHYSTLEALLQLASEGSSATLQLSRLGFPREHCFVFLISTNGHQMQFAVSYLLEPAFPCCAVVTKSLDLLDDTDVRVAASWCSTLQKRHAQLQTMLIQIAVPPIIAEKVKMGLSWTKYHRKFVPDIFLIYRESIDLSLLHLFRIGRHLRQSKAAAKCSVLPLALRTARSGQCALIFEKLIG